MGCLRNGGGEEGGVSPEPDGGCSAAGEMSSTGEETSFDVGCLGFGSRASALLVTGSDGASLPPRRSIEAIPILSSLITSRTDIPYGE